MSRKLPVGALRSKPFEPGVSMRKNLSLARSRVAGRWTFGVLAVGLALGGLGAGCTKKSSPDAQDSKSASADSAQGTLQIGLVLDKGGKDDKSFNTAAWEGTQRAVRELGVKVKDVEAPDDAAFEPAIRTFAERGLPLVISVGFAQADALKKVAPQFPNTKFAIVDAEVDAPNVASLMFAEHEGSYLVGYLAGLASTSKTVGFVGGMETALIRRFLVAYEAGARAANPQVKVLHNFVGINMTAWANPTRGKELALTQIGQGADIIFQAAGASGLGVFDAIADTKDRSVFGIGVDANQNWIKPGKIITSMLKRVDVAVFDVIREVATQKFVPGVRSFGLKDKGVDYAVDEHNQKLIEPHQAKLEKLREDIVAGRVQVPDYYVQMKAKPKK